MASCPLRSLFQSLAISSHRLPSFLLFLSVLQYSVALDVGLPLAAPAPCRLGAGRACGRSFFACGCRSTLSKSSSRGGAIGYLCQRTPQLRVLVQLMQPPFHLDSCLGRKHDRHEQERTEQRGERAGERRAEWDLKALLRNCSRPNCFGLSRRPIVRCGLHATHAFQCTQ